MVFGNDQKFAKHRACLNEYSTQTFESISLVRTAVGSLAKSLAWRYFGHSTQSRNIKASWNTSHQRSPLNRTRQPLDLYIHRRSDNCSAFLEIKMGRLRIGLVYSALKLLGKNKWCFTWVSPPFNRTRQILNTNQDIALKQSSGCSRYSYTFHIHLVFAPLSKLHICLHLSASMCYYHSSLWGT